MTIKFELQLPFLLYCRNTSFTFSVTLIALCLRSYLYLYIICIFVCYSALFSSPAPIQNASLPGHYCYSYFNCNTNVSGRKRGPRLANRKNYRITLSTTSENGPLQDRRCSKASLDCLPLTLRHSPRSQSNDGKTNVRRNCEKFPSVSSIIRHISPLLFFKGRVRCLLLVPVLRLP